MWYYFWDFLNNHNNELLVAVKSVILSSIATVFATLFVVERIKKKAKKNLLLRILYRELLAYEEPSETAGTKSYQMPHRDKLVWTLLTSDILNARSDKDLINTLYELIGWIENFNYTNNYANHAFSENSQEYSFFSNGRDKLYLGSYKERNKLLKLLKDKYNIS